MWPSRGAAGEQVGATVGAQALGNVWYRVKSSSAGEDGRRSEVVSGAKTWTRLRRTLQQRCARTSGKGGSAALSSLA